MKWIAKEVDAVRGLSKTCLVQLHINDQRSDDPEKRSGRAPILAVVICATHLVPLWRCELESWSEGATWQIANLQSAISEHLNANEQGCHVEVAKGDPRVHSLVCSAHGEDEILTYEPIVWWYRMDEEQRARATTQWLIAHALRMRPPLRELAEWGWFDPEAP